MKLTYELTCKKKADVIVCGGGVSGVAAALTAARRGMSVILIEKSIILGGLATLGQVNLFVAMCNGRGKQIIKGLADKWLHDSIKYGYDSLPEDWKNGEPEAYTERRLKSAFSPYIFAFQLLEECMDSGVAVLFDCTVTRPVMEGKRCIGVVTESKSGTEYYEAREFIDTTGDADLLRRSGMPVVKGRNYYTYGASQVTLEGCQKALEKGNIKFAFSSADAGTVPLTGKGQPEDIPLWSGTTAEEVNEYLKMNELELLANLKKDDRLSRELVHLPLMPQFRQTCRIDGDYALKESDVYRHFPDSVCAINDFSHRDFLYEVPLRCLCRADFPNLITSGRSAAGEGYMWNVVRVIPPAIVTGQAAGEAACLAIETNCDIAKVDIGILQKRLEQDDNIMIHFPDAYIPEDVANAGEYADVEGHK